MKRIPAPVVIILSLFCACKTAVNVDTLIINGTVYDGSGSKPVTAGVAISGDTIVAIGDLSDYTSDSIIDAKGMAVAPGFINVLSWAVTSLIKDGSGQSDTRQGVTLEIFGEGFSPGPLNPQMKRRFLGGLPNSYTDTTWTTLAGYLKTMENRVTPNIASFVGAATVREYVMGSDDRVPTAEELEKMKALVQQAMEEGALGLGTALIYPPGFFARTEELIELAKVAGKYNGAYISHLRSEGNQLLEGIDELIRIAKEANLHAEIYHLKMAGRENWQKFDAAVQKIDSARKAGLKITTDMYVYNAGATGLSATMPPWAQDGGFNKFLERLADTETRKKIAREMVTPTNKWENMFLSSGGPEGILLCGFRKPEHRKYVGKTLAEVAALRNQPPEQAAMDLILEDSTRVECVFFMMSDENIVKQLKLPYMSFCSDEESLAPEGDFLEYNPHPRAYGNVARLLGKYVRDEKALSLEQAIRGLTSLPAQNFKIEKRGALKVGNYADIVIFDPENIRDHATYDKPHQYSTGILHVWVNGTRVLANGEHTGATPGRVVYGPGLAKKENARNTGGNKQEENNK